MNKFVAIATALMIPAPWTFADEPKPPADSKVTVLYGGGDLSGWEGREDLWSAEDGQIVGRTTAEDPIDGNTFLIWKGGHPANFELTAQFKIEGGNSGIQYRSKIVDPAKYVVSGYQADIDFTNKFAGILYEEKGRGILAQRGQSVTIGADGKKKADRFGDAEKAGPGNSPGPMERLPSRRRRQPPATLHQRDDDRRGHRQRIGQGRGRRRDRLADPPRTSDGHPFQKHQGPRPRLKRFGERPQPNRPELNEPEPGRPWAGPGSPL